MTLKWPVTNFCWGHMYDSSQVSLCQSLMQIHQSMWIQFFNWQDNDPNDPYMTFDLTSVKVTCSILPKNCCVQLAWTYIKAYGYSDLFFQKNLNHRSMTPNDLDPISTKVTCVTLPKDHCLQVPWGYINVCRYSDQLCTLTTYFIHIHTHAF